MLDRGRISLAWKPNRFQLNICECSCQYIHCYLKLINGGPGFFITFIYALNERERRVEFVGCIVEDTMLLSPGYFVVILNV